MTATKAFSHERLKGDDKWLTPPDLLAKIGGGFDLDPCAPAVRPWPTAKLHYTLEDNGLKLSWKGRIWMNPPYGAETGKWMKRFMDRGDGIALTYARTETRWFQDQVFGRADGMLFIRGRLKFFTVKGVVGPSSAGAPSVLIAAGKYNVNVLRTCGIPSKFLDLRHD